jgi:uncharacterized protein YacL (UPF0231 family)
MLFLLALHYFVSAQEVAKTYTVQFSDRDQIFIEAQSVDLTYNATSSIERTLSVSGVSFEQNWQLTRQDQFITLRQIKNSTTKKAQLQITGSSIPVYITAEDVVVRLNNYRASTKMSFNQGSLYVQQAAGAISVFGKKCELSVIDSTSNLTADCYQLNSNIKNHNGNLKQFSRGGQVSVEQSKGKSYLQTYQTQAKMSWLSTNQVDVTVENFVGKTQVQLPKDSGAQLNLHTQGELAIPSELKISNLENEKRVKGKLSGDSAMSLNVRALEGSILVK